MKKGLFVLLGISSIGYASKPVWTFTPLTATSVTVPANGTGNVQYTVTNQSKKTHGLSLMAIPGVSQDTTGGNCSNPFTLAYQQSCTLSLNITGSQLSSDIYGGPIVCAQGIYGLMCNQPSPSDILHVMLTAAPSLSLSAVSPATGSAAGGVGVTLTGVNLTGATGVTFDNLAATSVNVVNSTTVTAVTPAHSAGAVNVVITTPAGSASLNAGFTYQTTAVGQSAYGGKIACLNTGNNLIAATADNSSGIVWSPSYSTTGATSITDGATNTNTIVAALGAGTYAAKLCSDYAVDSQGNSPCVTGNTCYDDWFLPAGNNTTASGQLNCLYTNRVAIGGFSSALDWSSTENNSSDAWSQYFRNGNQDNDNKFYTLRVRCVRAFTP